MGRAAAVALAEPDDDDWDESRAAFDVALADAVADNLTPPPRLTVSEWADKHRRLSSEASAEPGRWSTARAEYQRGIMDAVCDPTVPEVVVMKSSQVGWTEILLNVCGYYIHHDPAPILFVQPTVEMAQAFSKDRFAPMIRESDVLAARVQDGRITSGTASTILHKVFPGGHITMAGANSPASLASRPVRLALFDEVDRYPPSAGKEGDPVNLGRKRTTTFWNRKSLMGGTPTVKGHSRTESAYEASDKRQFWVKCPHCGGAQTLIWGQVRWPADEPEAAYYECSAHDPETGEVCGAHWTDVERWAAVKSGEWRAQKPFRGIAGFHLNEIYSPWVKLSDMARNFIEAKRGGPETLKTFINTSLGETWEESGERVDDEVLERRKERFGLNVAAEIVVITAGVDVQDDRLEIEFVGWGRDEESWSIGFTVLPGDPSTPELWRDLDELLKRKFPHELQGEMGLHAACIDTGGHYTQAAYTFCKPRQARNIWAIKGIGGAGKPIWPPRVNAKNKQRVPVYMIGVDAAKELNYARFKADEIGPGYCHFPHDRDDEYFRQLVAEEAVTVYSKGFPKKEWRLRSGHKRNEALDCRAYATAALYGLIARGLRLNHRASALGVPSRPVKAAKPSDVPAVAAPRPPTPAPTGGQKRRPKRRRVGRSSMMR